MELTSNVLDILYDVLQNQDSNDHMAYWLSNTSTLLCFLQRTCRDSQKPPVPTSFFGRVTQVSRYIPEEVYLHGSLQ